MPRRRKLPNVRSLGDLGRPSHQQTQHGLYFAIENKLFLQLIVLHATRHLRHRVVGFATSVRELDGDLHQVRRNVLVLDFALPGLPMDGLKDLFTRQLPGTPVLVFGVPPEACFLSFLARCGVKGLLGRQSTLEELREAISSAVRGEHFFSESLRHLMEEEFVERANCRSHALAHRLTGREEEVWEGIARGETSKQIAAEMHLSIRTVEKHRENIRKKTAQAELPKP